MAKKAMAKPRPKGDDRTLNDKMVEGWKERIEEVRKKKDWSMRRIGMEAGLGGTSYRHIITSAQTTTLDTIRRLGNALGVSSVWLAYGVHGVEGSGDTEQLNVKMLPIYTYEDWDAKEPSEDRGYVAVPAAKFPADVRALLVLGTAMQPDRNNEPPPPETVLLEDDVVLISPSVHREPGDLVLARLPRGLALRRLTEADTGALLLVPNNATYSRVEVDEGDIEGKVVAVIRSMM